MKIKIKFGPNVESSTDIIDVEDLGFSIKEWNNLSDEDKREKLQNHIDTLDRIVPILDNFTELEYGEMI